MTKKIQIKSIFALILAFTLLSTLIYAVSTNLQNPVDSFVDDDGFLDLRASCEPGYDGTTSYNITNATLYSNVGGIWKANKTLQVVNAIVNSTYYFNFTNSINKTTGGEFVWNAQCHEANSTGDGANINEAFAGNRTVKVEYARPTATTISPADGSFELNGRDILIECSALPTPGWNLTQIDLMVNISSVWRSYQTFIIPTRSVDTRFDNGFILNLSVGVDVTEIIFSCSATQIKDDLEGAPISEKSSSNRTLNIGLTCTGRICDIDNQRWCEGGLWNEGTYSHYCSRCGYADSSCPICEDGVCDIDNLNWCNNGNWSAINYCDSCGSVDSSCDTTCANNACDQKNRRWCNNGVWEESNYCVTCGGEDSICYFECQSNACDSKNKEWCDAGSWSSLNYCDHCQDPVCLGTCTNNACDANSKQWCNNGVWSDIDYCSRCGNKDSSCLVACQENTCDTTANKRCLDGVWVPNSYCDYCGLVDSDCTVVCAEGECDNLNKKVCISGEWTSSSYSTFCEISTIRDSCNDYGNCTLNRACANNSECASRFCSDSKCAESTCSNEIRDGDETGIDCGGNECVKCSKDKGCNANSDCLSDFCDSGICGIADTCSDGILNGNESDVDCGGVCGDKCQLGRSCGIEEDCDEGLECISRVCTKTRSADLKDTDEDGIPDEWEVEHGLDPSDPSDAYADFDGDGLTNIQEYTFGTNPNIVDTDGDRVTDKDEIINEGTDPLDPISKPGGIGGILIWAVILIMVFGGGSYGIYYYKDYMMELIHPQSQIPEPGITPRYMPPKRQYTPQKPVLKAPPKKTKITEIIKKRREEKKEIRQKIFQAFTREGASKQRKTGTTKETAFSKLKSVPKKGKS